LRLYIITGGSQGLGKSISILLDKEENTIVDISRSSAEFPCDLSDIDTISLVVQKIFDTYLPNKFTNIVLINNAGMIQPIAPVGKLSHEEIAKNLSVNLVAPIILSNEFLKGTADFSGKLKIVNISSGVSKRPKASWVAYSASKAGLEKFSTCLASEQEGRCEVFCCDPGLIDTKMQSTIRDSSSTDFPEVDRFRTFKNDGSLVSPNDVAYKVLNEENIL